MSFAVSNTSRDNAGSVSIYRGTWTSTVGDAAGSIAVGGRVLDADFAENATSGAHKQKVEYSVSVSGNTSTVTVYQQGTVTDGYFSIRFK